ncbi:hypothetical protein AB0F17_00085 [Nonomuraea sp. NPDC026600]|uniref:hypothetical protein n=1 Tax=Nonomuraea sp. NPDC026600 TaxID=3155363 RepID=UPI0033C0EFC3
MMAPGLAGTSGAAAADPACGVWHNSGLFPGARARTCIWGVGAGWKSAQTEVFNGSGSSLLVSDMFAYLDPLDLQGARCFNIRLDRGQSGFCPTRSAADNNPFQFDQARGYVTVSDPELEERMTVESPWVG